MKFFQWLSALSWVLLASNVTAHETFALIHVSASLKSSTCDVVVNGASSDATVTLPTVPSRSLGVAGQVAGQTPWALNLSNCDVSLAVYPYFYSATGSINSAGRLTNTANAPATNIELQVLNALGDPVDLSGAENAQNAGAPVIPSTGSATFDYAIQYYATGVSGVGNVGSSVTYMLKYI